MPSSAADSSNTSLETSSKAFSRSRKMVTARLLYPLLKVVIGAALCTRVAMASMVPTPLLKPREYDMIDAKAQEEAYCFFYDMIDAKAQEEAYCFLFITQSASLASHCQQRRRMTPT